MWRGAVEFAHAHEYAVAGFFADVAVVAKSLRNRHQRHAEIAGNLFYANSQ
jgi:hypothetical protein